MTAVGRFSTRPLYLQVKDTLIQRIAAGAWKPGAAIPNEIELSRELGISVGTVRKALDEMENERLISRRQGRGTFVIDQTSNEHAVRFSNIRDRDGSKIAGDTESSSVLEGTASDYEARNLQLRIGEPVYRIRRVLSHKGAPLMAENRPSRKTGSPAFPAPTTSPPASLCLPIITAFCWDGPKRRLAYHPPLTSMPTC